MTRIFTDDRTVHSEKYPWYPCNPWFLIGPHPKTWRIIDFGFRASDFGFPRNARLVSVGETGGHEAFEERVRRVGLALKLGVILAGEEPRVVAQFDEFHEFSIG